MNAQTIPQNRDLSGEKNKFTARPTRTLFNGSSHALFFSLGLALCILPGRAQDEASLKPSPPYVGALTGDFSFVKKYIYKSQPQNSNLTQEQKDVQKFLSRFPTIAEMDSTETGTLRWDKQSFTNGLSIEIWRVGAYRLTVYSSSPDSITVGAAASVGPDGRPVPGFQDTPEFQELGWINAGSYQGEQSQQGKTCYVYKSGDQTAWIEKSSRMPVFYDSSSMQVTYSYNAPDVPLQVPDKFAKKLQAILPAGRSN